MCTGNGENSNRLVNGVTGRITLFLSCRFCKLPQNDFWNRSTTYTPIRSYDSRGCSYKEYT